MITRRVLVLVALAVCAGAFAFAQHEDPPLSNWSAPPYWNPAVQPRGEVEPGGGMLARAQGMQAQADALPSSPLPLVAIAPCRIVDTRAAVDDGFHRPNFGDGETRTFNLPGSSDCTGLPATAGAWSLNIQFRPMTQLSFLTAFPTGTALPLVSTMTAAPAAWVQNAAIVPAGTGGAIDIYCQYAGRVIIDINGYYAPFLPFVGSASTPAGTDVFSIENTGNGRAMHAIASADTAFWARSVGGLAVDAWSDSNTGVFGHSTGGIGVDGLSDSNTGVFGHSTGGIGVDGLSDSNTGVFGHSSGGIGVDGLSDSNTGVIGRSTSGLGVLGTSSTNTGVWGTSAAGIGVDGLSDSNTGVFGHSTTGIGVDGFSDSYRGVFARSNSGLGIEALSVTETGVWGHSTSGRGVHGTSASNDGVVGATEATDQVAAGVRGTAIGSFGVVGQSTSWTGVFGSSSSGPGVHGLSETGDGVVAASNGDGKSGIFALNANPNGYAGFFNGHVRVDPGMFSVASLGPGPVCADGVGALINCALLPTSGSHSVADATANGALLDALTRFTALANAQRAEIASQRVMIEELKRRLAALEEKAAVPR